MADDVRESPALLATETDFGELVVEDIGAETEFNEGCCMGSFGTAGSIGSLGGCAGTALCVGSFGSFCAEA